MAGVHKQSWTLAPLSASVQTLYFTPRCLRFADSARPSLNTRNLFNTYQVRRSPVNFDGLPWLSCYAHLFLYPDCITFYSFHTVSENQINL
jgi:hypothetical protein